MYEGNTGGKSSAVWLLKENDLGSRSRRQAYSAYFEDVNGQLSEVDGGKMRLCGCCLVLSAYRRACVKWTSYGSLQLETSAVARLKNTSRFCHNCTKNAPGSDNPRSMVSRPTFRRTGFESDYSVSSIDESANSSDSRSSEPCSSKDSSSSWDSRAARASLGVSRLILPRAPLRNS